jgi:hypothetical protein
MKSARGAILASTVVATGMVNELRIAVSLAVLLA